ncbi:circularly permuted type 2 ATP-grasp protein [Quadrisphaera sp. INWT6]|uniref:circularly permuted type 2 ATP-grasp protein n=1 Tax=Quadrisphaera sp. INWT6 TaxID=2596917 RepID=UPI0018927232|nr:circularly permuted type 2 ATP-grasp protein [Quadrisphaera sp. INWT6]
MFTADMGVRETSAPVHAALAGTELRDLRGRADALASSYQDKGITFAVGGEERPFPLDVVPRVVSAQEWSVVEAGVAQRVAALEAFLADAYGPMRAVEDGVVPRSVITSSSHFHRVVAGIEPPNGVRVHVAGVDLVRDAEGAFRVLEDNVRVPSGVSYVLTNRSAMAGAMPQAFSDQRIRPVAAYPRRLLAALRAAAPVGVDDPTVVVLTPGVYNSAYFEHALLARSMGIELVEGRDLVCRGGRLLMRTTAGLRPVHVVYRRVDDEYLDPVHFRSDSMLGCPGLVNAARAGNVTLANGIGNGVADDKLLYTYVPDLVRYYLGEDPVLPNVPTWRLEEPEAREEVFDRLAELVVKPVDGSGGKGIVIGPAATAVELDQLRERVSADPRGWIAQPVVRLSTVPTLVGEKIAPRHVDLRPFAVNDGSRVWVLPGGLTRVALPEGELVVNSSQGGGSKDTWVLADDRPDDPAPVRSRSVAVPPAPSAPPDAGPGGGGAADVRDQQQQQQQVQQRVQQRAGGATC